MALKQSVLKAQKQALGKIDSIITMLEEANSMGLSYTDYAMSKVSGKIDSSLDKIDNYSNKISNVKDAITDPFKYLFDLLNSLNGTTNNLMGFVVKLLTYSIPTMETAVKATLLANIKADISCGCNPVIPNKYREFYYKTSYQLFPVNGLNVELSKANGFEYGEGFNISLRNIDPIEKLNISPFSTNGRTLYFGVLDGMNSRQLARPDDFDSAIWFAMNRAKYYGSYIYKDFNDLELQHFKADYIYQYKNNGKVGVPYGDEDFSLLRYFTVHREITDEQVPSDINEYNENQLINVAPGAIVRYPDSSMISMCTNIKSNERGQVIFAEFDAISDSQTGVFWYTDDFCLSLKDLGYKYLSYKNGDENANLTKQDIIEEVTAKTNTTNYVHPRRKYKEFPILKLTYNGMQNGSVTRLSPDGSLIKTFSSVNDKNYEKLNVKILPKPFIHYPCITKNFRQSPTCIKKILFDPYGNPDKKGYFSCFINPLKVYTHEFFKEPEEGEEVIPTNAIQTNYNISDDNLWLEYEVLNYNSISSISTGGNPQPIGLLRIDKRGNYELQMFDGHTKQECLYACYPKTTIYAFNYHYIMGMQLFDAKQLLASVFQFTFGINFAIDFGISQKQAEIRQRVVRFVRNICYADSSAVSDCFYSFNNDEYDALLHESDNKRLNGYSFNGVDNKPFKIDVEKLAETLRNYDSSATLNEQITILTRALNDVCVSIDNGQDGEDTVDIDLPFSYEALQSIIRNIVVAMISAIITPKVLLLININKELMGDYVEYDTNIEDLLKSFQKMIIELAKQIREMILQELRDYIQRLLAELMEKWSVLLTKEWIDKYRRMLDVIMKFYIPPLTKRRTLSSTITNVNYADIDNNNNPIDQSCE